MITHGRIGAAGGIVHERKVTSGSVGGTAVVKHERVGSKGGVLCAGSVEQERCHANCGVRICIIEGQRSTANTSIKTAGRIQKERAPTKCRISSASGQRTKRIAPFRCREIGIARVRYGCGCRRDADVIDVFFAVECGGIGDVGAGVVGNHGDVIADLGLIRITDKRIK